MGLWSLLRVFAEMEWVKDEDGHKVGHLRHFLHKLGLPAANSNQRAATFNKNLASVKHEGRLEQKPLPGKCGVDPYVGSKATFRAVYDFV